MKRYEAELYASARETRALSFLAGAVGALEQRNGAFPFGKY